MIMHGCVPEGTPGRCAAKRDAVDDACLLGRHLSRVGAKAPARVSSGGDNRGGAIGRPLLNRLDFVFPPN
jgi:hypothetical protein